MRHLNFRNWIIAGGLALCSAGVLGYHSKTVKTGEEICKEQGKEQQDKKLKTSLPMWESISRHLIMAGRN
jgi:hypothetical protein